MKTAIKLILIDLLIAQIVAPILIMIPCTIYLLVTTGDLDKVALTQMIMIPAQLAGQIMMGIYLWKAGYISKKKATWSPVSAPFLVCRGLQFSPRVCGLCTYGPARLDSQYHGAIFRHSPIRLGRYSCNSYRRSRT